MPLKPQRPEVRTRSQKCEIRVDKVDQGRCWEFKKEVSYNICDVESNGLEPLEVESRVAVRLPRFLFVTIYRTDSYDRDDATVGIGQTTYVNVWELLGNYS